jgi:hypothetical protein
MRKFTRDISFSDANNIIGVCSIIGGELSEAEKLIMTKLNKRLLVEFTNEAEDFEDRKEKAIDKKQTTITWTDADKKKKPIELNHKEISTVANIFLEALKSKDCNMLTVETIVNLAEDDCLKLSTYLNKNVNMEKIKLIEVPEDADLIPEESPQ